MKGIILAGGSGTRLYPVTLPVCKQLLPIYNKPMIYYPLSTLMLAGIKDVMIISTPDDTPRFEKLFGSGEDIGMRFTYQVQDEPKGLAQALTLSEDFVAGDNCCLILGDNIFYGHGLTKELINARQSIEANGGAHIFGYKVKDPERYGVVDFDDKGKVISIEEKPTEPKSNYAVVGLYFYDSNAANVAKNIKPSPRGELEITTVNEEYLKQGKLTTGLLGRGVAWLDAGTHASLLDTSEFIRVYEERTGQMISCVEEIAYEQGFIDKNQLLKLADRYSKNGYGEYLLSIANEER